MGTAASVISVKPQGIFHAAVATTGLTATGTKGGTVTTTGWTDAGFIDPEGTIKFTFSGNAIDVRPMGMEGNLKRIVTAKACKIEFTGLEDVVATLELALSNATIASNAIPDGGDGEVSYIALSVILDNYIFWFKKVGQNPELALEYDDMAVSKVPFILDTFVEEAATAGERKWKILERTAA